jgi:ABC-2 type transport system permease protein
MSGPATTPVARPREHAVGGVSMLSMATFEWRLVRAERVLVPLALFFAATIAYAAANGRSWVEFERDALKTATAEEAIRLATLGKTLDASLADTSVLRPFGDPRNPFVAGQGPARRYAMLPPAPLAPLAVGQSDLFPSYYRTGMVSRDTFLANDEVVNPGHLAAGRFDLAFVIVYIFPLLVLALSYDLLSAEREGGTLALVLSQPVRLRTVLAAKLFTRASLMVGLVLSVTLVGVAMTGVTIWTADDVNSLAAWTAVTVAYGLFWFSLGVIVNVFGRSSSVNALVLLGAWLLLVVLGPSTLDLIVTAMHPTPSRVELMQATRAASNTATARGSQLLAMYVQDHPELMRGAPQGAPEFATRSLVVADEVARAVGPITARFDSELDAQQRLIDRWRWISPALVTHVALVDVAGTGTRRYRDFQRQSDAYITVLRAFYEPRITRGARLTRQDIGAIPSFTFDERTLGPATERAWWAATVLATIAIAITVAALSFARTTAQNSTR